MRKKTIGEVLRLARVNQGLSLEELQDVVNVCPGVGRFEIEFAAEGNFAE